MNKEGFLTVISVFIVVIVLAICTPLSQLKADHCHTEQTQPTAPSMNESARTKAPNTQRQHTRTTSEPNKGRYMERNVVGPIQGSGANAIPSLEDIYSKDLPMAILSIGQAVDAAESGDKKTELAELKKAVTTLVTIRAALEKHIKPQFANTRCPIMGTPIEREKVNQNLIRDYNGQKIAFCCAGCPSAWDKLTDAQKQSKLYQTKS